MTRRWYLRFLLLVVLAGFAVVVAAGSASAASCRSNCVDLSVSVSDGVSSLVPGGPVAYVVSVRNGGPSTVSSVVLAVASPAALRNPVFVPTSGTYNPGSGLWSGLNLAAGHSVSMLVAGIVDPAATGTLTESLTVAAPAGSTETNPANNNATDTDTLAPVADLGITVSDGTASAVAGAPVSYLVTVSNCGLSTVGSLLLTDLAPANLNNVSFLPAAGSYNATTHLWAGLSLATGHNVTMTVSGTVDPAATGKLTNTVSVAPPAGVTDPRTANNTATDTDTITTRADLSISVSDAAATATPGNPTSYMIRVSNSGPSTATGAAVTDTLSAAAGSDSWTASGTAGATVTSGSGSGNIATTATLPPASTVTFTVVATVSATATGTISNTATVTAPAGLTDPNPANNTATDTDTLTPQADLSITNDDGATAAVPGGTTLYTITVTNNGPSTATAATVTDPLPAGTTTATWTATATAGSSIAAATGSGPITTTTTLLAGGSATYTLTTTIDPAATGTLTNTATTTPPPGTTDPNPTNNTATDTDNIGACTPPGTTGCPWAPGDFITYAESEWAGDSTATYLLAKYFETVYDGSGGVMVVGDLPTALLFDSPTALYDYLPACGPPAALAVQLFDPGCNTESGVFGGDVTALKLNVDFYDAGVLTGAAGLKFGDLTLCNLPTAGNTYPTYDADLHALNGTTVRQFLAIVSAALSGEPSAYTPAELDPLLQSVDASFTTGVNTVASSYLYNGDCP